MPLTTSETGLVIAMVREGGVLGLAGMMFYFYRRDWMRLQDQTRELIGIVHRASDANERVALALKENTEVMRSFIGRARQDSATP